MALRIQNADIPLFTRHLIAVSAVIAVGFLIYSNSLHGPFAFDDFDHIVNNRFIRITDLDSQSLWDAAFKSRSPNQPVANLSLALNYYLGTYNVFGYHIFNILIHIFNGILVFFVAQILLTQDLELKTNGPARNNAGPTVVFFTALTAALMFVAHPLQVQSVSYIIQRMNSMAVMFFFCAFLLYIHGRRTAIKRKRWILWIGSFTFWILALGSKPIAATLPFIIWLYEWYFLQNMNREWLKRNLKYCLGLVILLVLLILFYLGKHPIDKLLEGYMGLNFSLPERTLTEFRVVVFYLSLLFYPHPSRLNLIHDFSISHSLFAPATTLFALLFIIALLVLALFIAPKRRLLSFCIFWFFIHLLIESTVIGIDLVFEHRLYLPMFGFTLFGAYALFALFSDKTARAIFISAFIVFALGTGTFIRNRVWQDNLTLWSDVIAKNPRSDKAHFNLGSDLIRKGKLEDAILHISQALRIKPNYAKAHSNLGVALERQGKIKQAMQHYYQALKINPGSAVAHYNIGVVLKGEGKMKEAVFHYLEALRLNPYFAEARNNLFIALDQQGKHAQALHHLTQALKGKPDHAVALNNLAVTKEKQGRLKEALDLYFEALRVKPDYAVAYNNLGVLLTRLGILKGALRCFTEAMRLKPGDAGMHNNLGAAFDRQGEHQKAVKQYKEALRLKPDYAQAHNNLGIELTRQGRHREAIMHFTEALRINPNDPQIEYNLNLARKSLASKTY